MKIERSVLSLLLCAALMHLATGRAAPAGDWPQWAGTPGHNMVSDEKGLPETFHVGNPKRDGSDSGLGDARNVKWAAMLGARTNGSPVIARGRVFMGSNSAGCPAAPDTKKPGGWFLCLDERTGKLLWQLVIPKLSEAVGPHSDTSYGVCSSATVEGDRVYLVSNRGELLCLDIDGMANGNDGPFQAEAEYLTWTKAKAEFDGPRHEVQPTDGDILWLYDMLKEMKVHPHDASSCSVLVHGDFLYVCTGNGVDRGEKKVVEPLAPSLVVFDKRTGRLVAWDDEKIGTRLYKGQWSSPSLSVVGGKAQIIYGGGDGLCYAFEPLASAPDGHDVATLRKMWAVECNPDEIRLSSGNTVSYFDKRRGPSEIVSTPVCLDGRIYVTIGRDPHHGKGPGCVTCIDAAKGTVLWRYLDIGRSISSVSVHDGLVFVAETFGMLHCLDAATGRQVWTHPTKGNTWGSTLVADGKLYLGTSREFLVLAAGRDKKVLSTIQLGGDSYATPCAANGVLYVASQRYLYAVCDTKDKPPIAASAAAKEADRPAREARPER